MFCVRLDSAVLCTHLEPNVLIAGGYNGYIYHVDLRSSTVVSRQRHHRGSALSITVDDKNIVSVGEDSMLVVFDRRQNETNRVTVWSTE